MSRIYVVAPDGRTGGVEALFQLSHELRLQGHEAYLVPTQARFDLSEKLLTSNCDWNYANLYTDYDVACTTRATINPEDAIIFPEIFMDHVENISKIPCRKYIWWLSATNGFKNYTKPIETHPAFSFSIKRNFIHLFQSFHAAQMLQKYDIAPCHELKCYIGKNTAGALTQPRQPIVLCNPSKDQVFWRMLARQCPEVTFLPLIGLDDQGMRRAFSTASIYIDFGSHPGMDRIPREAALNKVIVVTGKNGAAGNPVDIPIHRSFKFDDEDITSGVCAQRLREMIARYPEFVKLQNPYRGFISGQRKQFSMAVECLWGNASR